MRMGIDWCKSFRPLVCRAAVAAVLLFAAPSRITMAQKPAEPQASFPRYAVIDLGPMQRIAADVVPGLSASGNVAFSEQTDSEAFVAVQYSAGSYGKQSRKLLPEPEGYLNSFPYSVNDAGDSVGWANTTLNPVDSTATVHAVLFRNGHVTDLGTLGGLRSRAYAINNQGMIAGVSELPGGQQRAFRYSNGKMAPLNTLPGGSYGIAFDINDSGVIVGGSGLPSSTPKPLIHAVIWRGNSVHDLGALSEKGNSLAYAINNHDDVVGVSDTGDDESVFLYADGKMQDLHIAGHALSINDQRQIVGTLTPQERKRPRGFLWENGELHDLNTLLPPDTYRIEVAYRINNRGQILCRGYAKDGFHLVLLVPAR